MKNNLQDIFVPYELARILKDDLGFDNSGIAYYFIDNLMFPNKVEHLESQKKCAYVTGGIIAPTWEQAFKWFREKHQIVFCYEPCLKKDLTYNFFIYLEVTGEKVFVVESKYNKEAELACLKKLIQIVKTRYFK